MGPDFLRPDAKAPRQATDNSHTDRWLQSLALRIDDVLGPLKLCTAGVVVHELQFPPRIDDPGSCAGLKAGHCGASAFTVLLPGLGHFFIRRFFACCLVHFGLLLFGFKLRVTCRQFDHAGFGRRCDGGRGLRQLLGRRGLRSGRLFEDIFFRNFGRGRPVAEDLAAIFVNPLPLGQGGGGRCAKEQPEDGA